MYRPLFFTTLSFALGIFVQHFLELSFTVLCTLCILLTVINIFLVSKKKISSVLLLILFFFLGTALISESCALSSNHIKRVARFYGKDAVELEGVVVSAVKIGKFHHLKKMSFVVDVKRLKTKWGWKNKRGRILVNIFDDYGLFYGDYVLLKGKLHRPFNFKSDGQFSYRNYLKQRWIHYILSVKKENKVEILSSNNGNLFKAWSLRARNRLKNILSDKLTENESGIMNAVLLGDRTRIPKHVRELFVRTGTAHVLAISGLHIGIVMGLFFVILKLIPIKRKAQYLINIILLVSYSFLTGGRPSVVRATIMAVIFLSSFIVEREPEPINSLSLAALIILIVNPMNLFDVGFQLSFTSVLSIICFYPIIMSICVKVAGDAESKFVVFIMQSLSVSISAWLGVIGIIAYYFHIVTPITILANLIIVPLIGTVIALGLGLMITAFIPMFSSAFAACIKIMMNIMVGVIYLYDKCPFSCFYLKDVSLWYVIAYYFLLCVLFCSLKLLKLTK